MTEGVIKAVSPTESWAVNVAKERGEQFEWVGKMERVAEGAAVEEWVVGEWVATTETCEGAILVVVGWTRLWLGIRCRRRPYTVSIVKL